MTAGGAMAAQRQPWFDRAQPPADHAFVTTTKPKVAAAAKIGAALVARKRGELLGLLRSCFVRPEPWLQAGKYVGALVSDLQKRNGPGGHPAVPAAVLGLGLAGRPNRDGP